MVDALPSGAVDELGGCLKSKKKTRPLLSTLFLNNTSTVKQVVIEHEFHHEIMILLHNPKAMLCIFMFPVAKLHRPFLIGLCAEAV